MGAFTTGTRTVQLIERNERERQALQQLLESLGLHVEAFASLGDRAPGTAECLLWSVDDVGPQGEELDKLLAEIGEGTSVVVLGRAPPLPIVVRTLKAGAVDVLCKPIEPTELRRTVLEAFER